MSELREELLGSAINKKRILGIALVAMLLIGMFAFSVVLFSFLFGTQRPFPSKEKAETEYEDALLTKPPYPFNESFWEDLFNDLSPDQLADVMDMLSEMLDGGIDDLDLSAFSEALLALLGSQAGQQEVFRVYDYDSIINMTNKLWRYECFDEFMGDQWHSTAATDFYDFYSYSNYSSKYSYLDLIQLKIPLSPNLGPNSMVIPSFFPIPFIMEGLYADNLDLDSVTLFKNDFNCTTLDLQFYSEDPVNMTYEMFGLNLPSNVDINNSAVEAQYTPLFIKNKYLQLPPSIDTYINTHPYFKSHYDALDLIIEDNDNTFMVANKIRNYLQTNFIIDINALTNDPPADGEDIVEWFCEHGEGLWSEFASAFCAFTRAFNVSSRFVDGFHSQGIVENFDFAEGRFYFPIKYMNLYNWAEIFVPTSISGDGMWVQMDIIFDSFGAGGNPMANYRIKVNSSFTAGYRGPTANLTATLSSDTGSIDNKRITFTDLNSGLILGEAYTDQNGTASILVNINSSQVVGPHLIMASYQLANNFTSYIVYGNIQVNLTNVNPPTINRSISTTTNIRGYVYDPIANQGVRNATVEFVLLEKSTQNKIINPFDINYIDTDVNGNFNEIVNVNPWVPRGNYEIRVDFNGSWGGVLLAPGGIMDNSSNKMDFTITEELTYRLLFSIDGQPTDFPFPPNPGNLINVKRGEQLNLSVILIDEDTMSPDPGENIEFYDYTNGNVIIGTDITNPQGIASFIYDIGDTNKSGPTLVYAKYGGDFNYSYYIVNETIEINVLSYTDPLEYDLATQFPFNIQCELRDSFLNPIFYSQLDLRMNWSIFDYTGFLTPPNPEYPSPLGSDFFNFNRGVIPGTPLNNYTLRLEFNGYFDFFNYPYPATFNLAYLNNYVEIPKLLNVYDSNQVQIYLAVEWNPTSAFYDDGNPPERYNTTTMAQFQVQVVHVLNLSGNPLYIYDDFTNTLLDTYYFPDGTGQTGFHQFDIPTASLHGGLHRIRVQYHTYSTINRTYIIVNDTVDINVNPDKNEVIRGVEGFGVFGTVQESGEDLRGLIVSIILLNATYDDVTSYLNLVGSQSIIINNDGTFSYTISSIDQICPQGKYYIRIDFNGSIEYPNTGFPNVLLTDYMIHTNSSLVPINITAGTMIIQDGYHTIPHDISDGDWWVDDILYVYGNLTWDNGTAMANMKVNITVQLLNGEIVAFNDTVVTDQYGGFNASLIVDNSWPDYVYQTKIIVYFEPEDNNLEYVDKTELEFI